MPGKLVERGMMDCKGDLASWCLPNLLPLSVGFLQLGVFSRLSYFRDREPLGIPANASAQLHRMNCTVAGNCQLFGGSTPKYTDTPWFGVQPWGKAPSRDSGWVFDILAGLYIQEPLARAGDLVQQTLTASQERSSRCSSGSN